MQSVVLCVVMDITVFANIHKDQINLVMLPNEQSNFYISQQQEFICDWQDLASWNVFSQRSDFDLSQRWINLDRRRGTHVFCRLITGEKPAAFLHSGKEQVGSNILVLCFQMMSGWINWLPPIPPTIQHTDVFTYDCKP